ncbi:MAG: hypothetical protein VKL97_02025 [Cyanobacteriota bacterium]|nr:hypothetical protein [Cyanobacteriota bacterium]
MVSASDPRQDPVDSDISMPSWLFWLQLGLTTTLAVLFVVMLVRTRQQGADIRSLQDKVAGIENRSALDRTTAIEDQLRSTSERLQALERQGAQVAALSAENNRLRLELRGLEGTPGKPAAGLPGDDTLPPLPPLKP